MEETGWSARIALDVLYIADGALVYLTKHKLPNEYALTSPLTFVNSGFILTSVAD